jgi:predicted  nucleic acid-binding Zn-ribbon protein
VRADLDAELLVSQNRAIELQTAKALQDVTSADLQAARTELESTRKQLEEASSSLSAVKAREAALVQEVMEVRSQNKEQTTVHKQALQKEKETSNRLASGLQQSKVAEEELRAEINQYVTTSDGSTSGTLSTFADDVFVCVGNFQVDG